MKHLAKILQQSKYQLAFGFFVPVFLATGLYFLGYPFAGFVIFQFFIEFFVLWHFAIGLTLSKKSDNQGFINIFIFNMLFALAYRLSSNFFQIWFACQYGQFPKIEEIWWIIPIHTYASVACLHCFYLNARWICEMEAKLNLPNQGLRNTFLQILFFPFGLWYIQPRLNIIAQKLNFLKPSLSLIKV
jgi:hypothetical protein